MASTKIIVPDFQFSGTYYPDILRRVRLFNRINAPEITSEVAEEPFIQLERAFALVGHLCNVLLDLSANEVLLPTLKLQDSARTLLKLIDFQLRDYSPAVADLLIELPQALAASTQIFEDNSLFETVRDQETDAIPYEIDALTIGPTNVPDAAYFDRLSDRGLEPNTGSDLLTPVGDADAVESATALFTSADIGRLILVDGSIFGNNGLFQIAEILSTTRARLVGVFGDDAPNFIPESGLNWQIRNYGSNLNTQIGSAATPVPDGWGTPAAGDKFYLGSTAVMWNELDIVLDTAYSGLQGVWEYHDPDLDNETPDAVANQTTFLRVTVNSLLGTDDVNAALVRVTYLPTGVSELLISTFVGGVNVVDTSAFLGQTGTPSLDPDDYSISAKWVPLENQTDGSSDLTQDGKLEYDFPQTTRRAWKKVTVNGLEAFYLRYRIIAVVTPAAGAIDTMDIAGGKQYLLPTATQGETVTNEPLKSSNGQKNQEFVLTRIPALRDTVRVFVDEGGGEVEWTNITIDGKTLLTSGAKYRHFEVAQNSIGEVTVRFGDGTRGRVPTLGIDNLRFEYRIGADDDGNVGAEMITVNSGGSSFAKNVSNPRPATSWREADGASEESLALVKEEGPASLRTLNRACAPSDYQDLTLQFTSSNGTRPVVRALAIEEGYGPKTMKLVVVGTNGVAIPSTSKTELETYFNGDDSTGEEGVGMLNQEVTVVNFTPRIIGLTIVVEANEAVTEDLIRTTLATLLNPTAQNSSGSFVWSFGGKVPTSRIASEIFNASPGNVFDVDIAEADFQLSDEELPIFDSSNTTISVVSKT